ncbi:MAG: hypothetical protein JNK14_19790 [Chitinophagaceae bacterium]|nr:hypothetical protein [Chitinophagaceae bacterium]
MRSLFLSFLFFYVIVAGSCDRLDGKSFVPAIPGYADHEKSMVILKRPLREISGIDYIGQNRLVAINDETGKIFFVDPFTGKHEAFDFGKRGDYEDVVKAGDHYYVMNSKGHIFQVTVTENKLVGQFENKFGKGVEFESLYYDRALERLILICKECGRGSTSINAYQFDLATKEFLPQVYFTIKWSDIRRMAKDNQIECRPSAAALNPAMDKLFIIASVGKVLLQCSRTGVLEKVYEINPDHFQQPEGITFAPNGDMFISNEGIQGKGSLLYFPYTP